MDDSPLLRLPPEIRDAIYAFVLGGNDLHSWAIQGRVSLSLCVEERSHSEIVRTIKSRESENLSFPTELDHAHYKCNPHGHFSEPRPSRPDLSLLLVCRKVGNQAAGILFKTNTFVCHDLLQLQYFSHSLSETQRQLVTNVCLVTSFPELQASHMGQFARRERLTGVRRLVVVLGVPNSASQDVVRRFLRELEERFDRHSMVSVDILIRFRKRKDSLAGLRMLHQQYAKWARDTEQALLRKVSDERKW